MVFCLGETTSLADENSKLKLINLESNPVLKEGLVNVLITFEITLIKRSFILIEISTGETQ